ncbi:MAG TPA: pitrilysin family protein [Planctomycetota bacterium]|nr:pitrilysin family protein [Planctomycetota bacterium]
MQDHTHNTWGPQTRLLPVARHLYLLIATALCAAHATSKPTPSAPQANVPIDHISDHTLANGWTFIFVSREGPPILTFQTRLDVGSIHERDGIRGMAHMFEHMAFKGSDRVGSLDWPAEQIALARVDTTRGELLQARAMGDAEWTRTSADAFAAAQEEAAALVDGEAFSRLLEDAGGGGSLNAFTRADATGYVVSLPANALELWCWLERERFTRPVLREFYREVSAVIEERNMRVDSAPFGALLEAWKLAAFSSHPYRHPVIGYAQDIAAYDRDEAAAFFRANYNASRLVTTVVGDIDRDTLIPMLERYFGDLPAGPPTPPVGPPEPEQAEQIRIEVPFPAEPLLILGWKCPPTAADDGPAVEVAARLLGVGASSRLERRLVREEQLAAYTGAGTAFPDASHANLTYVIAVPNAGVEPDALESAILEEIDHLAQNGADPQELAGVKRVARAEFLRSMRESGDLAGLLCEYHARTGHWRNAFRETERINAVTDEAVRAAVKRYLRPERCTVATLVRPAEPDDPPGPNGADEPGATGESTSTTSGNGGGNR